MTQGLETDEQKPCYGLIRRNQTEARPPKQCVN